MMSGTKPELSYKVDVTDIPSTGLRARIEANEEERAKLAKRYGILSLDSLTAKLELKPWRKRGVAVSGHFTAEVTQACVVTLEPLSARLEEDFKDYFLPEADMGRLAAEAEITVEIEGADPDPLEGDQIDLGELVAEHVSLAIDPYPRKEGVEFSPPPGVESQDSPAEPKENPFAVLEKLRGKDK